ncbi:hypothetical protein E8E13_006332 [Curvularia kusanoi]|uniref:Uncharacterized protein n=1 Tax=Curvularia kusanoi TaxID=90978 RepID=A0A9P4TAB6_CURKU|nr:hypothetical protein E8E13_006332 [Curvularia kusanoi]
MKPWEVEEADRLREHQVRVIAQQRSLLLQRVLGAASQQQQSGQVSPQYEQHHVQPHPFTTTQRGEESAPESQSDRAELAIHQSRRTPSLNPHISLAPQQMFNNSAETWRSSQTDPTAFNSSYHPQANKKDAHSSGNMTQRFTPHLMGGEQSPRPSTVFRSLEAPGPRRPASQTPTQSPSLPSSPPIYVPASSIILPSVNPSTDWSRTQRKNDSNEPLNKQRNAQRASQRNEHPTKDSTEHLNEQRERARLAAQSAAETEAWNRRSLALRRDPHVNFRNYLEYLQHFPLRRGERPNPYLAGLLANQLMPAENDKSDRAVAVRWAKVNWEMYWEVRDVRYVVERVREGRRREEERERWMRGGVASR